MFDLYWWCSALALFVGCFIQTALGFGMAVVAAPIIVLFRPDWVPVILTIVALMLSVKNAWSQRQDIQWVQMQPALLTRIPGTLAGAWVLTLVNEQWLQIMVASMVFVAIFITGFIRPFPTRRRNLAIASVISGFTGTTTSIGGPPIALVMQHSAGHHTRANLSMYFTYACIMSLLSYAFIGLLDWQLALTGISFLPVALAGFFTGRRAQGWVDSRFRPLLLALCSVSALIALLGAFSH